MAPDVKSALTLLTLCCGIGCDAGELSPGGYAASITAQGGEPGAPDPDVDFSLEASGSFISVWGSAQCIGDVADADLSRLTDLLNRANALGRNQPTRTCLHVPVYRFSITTTGGSSHSFDYEPCGDPSASLSAVLDLGFKLTQECR